MQPIHYSLIFNIIGALLAAGLAWQFQQPWLLVIVLMIQNHALELFRQEAPDPEFEEEQPMGFTADIR